MSEQFTDRERVQFNRGMDDLERSMGVAYVRMEHPEVFDEMAAAIGRCRRPQDHVAAALRAARLEHVR